MASFYNKIAFKGKIKNCPKTGYFVVIDIPTKGMDVCLEHVRHISLLNFGFLEKTAGSINSFVLNTFPLKEVEEVFNSAESRYFELFKSQTCGSCSASLVCCHLIVRRKDFVFNEISINPHWFLVYGGTQFTSFTFNLIKTFRWNVLDFCKIALFCLKNTGICGQIQKFENFNFVTLYAYFDFLERYIAYMGSI